jgi:hypothetical protein
VKFRAGVGRLPWTMETLIVFGSFVTIVVAILRHRYRMKLLAAATPRPEFAHLSPLAHFPDATRGGKDAQARIEALEERLEWLERLVRESGEAKARVEATRVGTRVESRVESLASGAGKVLAAITAHGERETSRSL